MPGRAFGLPDFSALSHMTPPTEAGCGCVGGWVQGEGTPTPAQALDHLEGKCAGLPREQKERDFPSTGD